jgi:type VI protein secretion system component VasK
MVGVAAYAAMAAVTVALAAAWTTSYFTNRALVADAQARTEAASRSLSALKDVRPGDEPRLLATLGTLRDLMPASSGALGGFGLDQRDKLAQQAERAYRNSLRETLLGHLAASLESALRSAPTREALEAYVSLYDNPAQALLEKSAQSLWRLPDAARADLAAHLKAALAERPLALPRTRDDALVEQARRRIEGTRA